MESMFIQVNSVKLHVIMAGPQNGPLVVLLHGFPAHWLSYRNQIPVLINAGFRVMVPDQRGYNLSDKPEGKEAYGVLQLCDDVVQLIKHAGYQEAVIVGHDWGGVVAHRLAMDYKDMVQKLVIINSPHPAAMKRELKRLPQLMRSWYFFYFQMPKIPEALFAMFPRASARLFLRASSVVKNAHSEDDIEEVAAAISRPGTMSAMINWYRRAASTRQNNLKKISADTLVIWGEKDPALGVNLTRGLEEWFSTLKLIKLADIGHWPQIEAAPEVNRHLLSFLAT